MKKILMFVCLLALCNLTLFAQTEERPRTVPTAEDSAIHVPPQDAPEGLTKIYSNLGKKNDLYGGPGFPLSGPNSTFGTSFFTAMPFTPKSAAHVSQVQVAVQYFSGANQINLSIYSDSGGVPGVLLAGPVTVTNLPKDPSCCLLAVASFSPVAVSAGTQYWVVADTPLTGVGSDFSGTWARSVRPIIPSAFDRGSGWFSADLNELPAGEVLGTIP